MRRIESEEDEKWLRKASPNTALSFQFGRIRVNWVEYLSIGAGISLFIWGEGPWEPPHKEGEPWPD